MNNLASLLFQQGRFSEAGPLYRQVLTVQRALLGPDHPGVLTTLTSLVSNTSISL
jgi:hypothetical protein